MINFPEARASLIKHLSAEIKDRQVLAVMSRIPREFFVPEECMRHAYEDRPLHIGHEQTISQPYIVACMTQALDLTGKEKVLEIGTGSGYQAAILAELSKKVVSVERLPALAETAGKALSTLGLKNIELHLAEETLGWKRGAPYDAILVTAAAPKVPDDLITQLAMGGRMVIPVGSRYLQELCKITRLPQGNRIENFGACRFVSLIGRGAWKD